MLIDKLGELNPQLFRELKGRLKPRPVSIFVLLSLVTQIFFSYCYRFSVPVYSSYKSDFNRYCIGKVTSNWQGYKPHNYHDNFCVTDALGNLNINWQLWWLDMFVVMSIIGIFMLLVLVTYMLIVDLSKEATQGTLNFIRLSPQSARSIFTGKMLGVPALLYIFVLVAIPLHLRAGLGASIPLWLIFSFYLVTIASCVFFYSIALIYGLVNSTFSVLKGWLGCALLLFFLFPMMSILIGGYRGINCVLDWFCLFYPGIVLPYLVDASGIDAGVNYFQGTQLEGLSWHNLSLWKNSVIGIGAILFNYCFCTYWLGQILKRRFHNPTATSLGKKQSYLLSGSLTFILLGFTFQDAQWLSHYSNYAQIKLSQLGMLLGLLLLLFLGLTIAISPQRQTLVDWARYRHPKKLLHDLIWQDKSPSTLALGINFAIVGLILLPVILLLPLEERNLPTIWGLLLSLSLMLACAAIFQLMLLMKTQHRAKFAIVTIIAFIFLVPLILAMFQIDPTKSPQLWLYTILAMVATQNAKMTPIFLSLLGQWLAIALISFQTSKQLNSLQKKSDLPSIAPYERA